MAAADAASGGLADALFDTTAFDEAEQTLQGILGWTELDYERQKAATQSAKSRRPTITNSVLQHVREFELQARERGTELVTFRRLAEAAGTPQAHEHLRAQLLEVSPDKHRPPLWMVRA